MEIFPIAAVVLPARPLFLPNFPPLADCFALKATILDFFQLLREAAGRWDCFRTIGSLCAIFQGVCAAKKSMAPVKRRFPHIIYRWLSYFRKNRFHYDKIFPKLAFFAFSSLVLLFLPHFAL